MGLRVILILLIACTFIGCQSNKTDGTKYTDQATGREFNQEQWEKLDKSERDRIIKGNEEANEGGSFMDKILSAKVVFLYAIGAILCMIGGIVCMMQKPAPNIIGAVSCAAAAALTAVLPVLVALFWKGGIIILWIIGGLLLVCAAIIAYFFWHKMRSKFHASERDVAEKDIAISGLVATTDHVLDALEDGDRATFEQELKEKQCAITKKAVTTTKGK